MASFLLLTREGRAGEQHCFKRGQHCDNIVSIHAKAPESVAQSM